MEDPNYFKALFREQFAVWCKNHPLFIAMQSVVENSPWHRESNVLVHTQMVVDQYMELSPSEWSEREYIGAVACAFHDVGKPSCRIEKHSESRGIYYAYHGHELKSARLFEDFATKLFPLFSADQIFSISWMIEHHLPWETTDKTKLHNLALTAVRCCSSSVFCAVLLADQLGRVSDNSAEKLASARKWIDSFTKICESIGPTASLCNLDKPTLVMAIGPSGCGKSTMVSTLAQSGANVTTFSLDALRHQWYGTNYNEAFKQSCEDASFNQKTHGVFIDMIKDHTDGNDVIYVDNTNRTAKSRRFFLTEAKRRGYNLVALLFPTSLDTVINRQQTRGDKSVPADVVRQQYYSVQMPSYGEFDLILCNIKP